MPLNPSFFEEVVKWAFHLVKAVGKACKIDLFYIMNIHKSYSYTLITLFFALLLVPIRAIAQDTEGKKKETPAEIKKAATNLERSLIQNDNATIARNYELLALEFIDKDDLVKAEESLTKALEIYTIANTSSARARVMRSIARVQELQNKLQAALGNYKAAMEAATDETSQMLNSNDYNRLKNKGNFDIQNKYLEANIALLKKKRKKAEVADTYLQQAALNLEKTDSISALEKYEFALKNAVKPEKRIRIYSEMAKLHVSSKHFEEALPILDQLLEEARKINNQDTEVTYLRQLAMVHFEMGNTENAIEALKESYKIAASTGRTFEARESLKQLIDHYTSVGDDKSSLEMYGEFLQNLDRIILSDNSLTDAKTFKVTEERIRRLESEKTLKDELISRKNTFNYFLIGSMVLLLLFFGSIVKALYSIKTKNKEIALQSLRREMNPHFLFNSLNSVNQFIAQNNELEANKYLTSYSNLMRNTMENSNKDFVTLGNEIENLTEYLELEHLRFKDKFDFEINVDEKLDPETIWVPNMIVQPHLENAIWHGLRYKEGKGLLKMNFTLSKKIITITIDDDGIGPTKSSELKTHNQKAHQSRGLTNTKERMTLLNELYKTKMSFSVTEKKSPETGTIVEITFPIIYKP
jgi:two-component system, sensor histidine kinase YesM